MKWNIDKAIAKLEPPRGAGTTIQRVLLDVALFEKEGLKLRKHDTDHGGHVYVWCLAIGYLSMPKAFFYGHTIREAYLKALKAAKNNDLARKTPWGNQLFEPAIAKKKGRKKAVASKEASG